MSRTPLIAPDTMGNKVTVPSCPPPLIHVAPQSQSSCTMQPEPFEVCFIGGNISVCYGCRQKYPKYNRPPPSDICIKHKEWREYFPTGSATPQSKYGNCYYHCNIPCILAKCPYYQGKMLKIPPTVAAQLLPVHTEHLVNNMGFNA